MRNFAAAFLVSLLASNAPAAPAKAAAASPVPAAPSAFGGPVTTTPIAPGMYQLSAGSNAVLAVGQEEAILVDTLFSNPENLVKAVHAITPLPVRLVVTTHAHRDHTGANAAFAELGANIVSTWAAARRIAAPSRNNAGVESPPIAPEGWPSKSIDREATVEVPGVKLRIIPVQRSHTDGDAMVFFPDANVLVLGDLHHSHEYPVYDAQTGCACGSYEGNLQVYREALKLTNDRTRIVAGHGCLTNKREVEAYVRMLLNVRTRVQAMIDRGMTREQVVAAKPLAADKSVQPGGPDNRDSFMATLYTALKTGQGA